MKRLLIALCLMLASASVAYSGVGCQGELWFLNFDVQKFNSLTYRVLVNFLYNCRQSFVETPCDYSVETNLYLRQPDDSYTKTNIGMQSSSVDCGNSDNALWIFDFAPPCDGVIKGYKIEVVFYFGLPPAPVGPPDPNYTTIKRVYTKYYQCPTSTIPNLP